MLGRIVAWLPWLVAEGFLARTEAEFWPDGGLWLLVLWTAILLLYRGFAALVPDRGGRLVLDALFAGFCVLAAWEGGWLMLPAVAAFSACDTLGLRIRLPAIPHDAGGNALRVAVAAAGIGWAGLALGISGPMYASAGTIGYPNGTVVSTHSPAPLVAGGVEPLVVALLAVAVALFALIGVVAAARARGRIDPDGRMLLATAGALVVVAIAAIPAAGLWLIPGAGLGVIAALVARDPSPRIDPRHTAGR